MNLYSIQCNEIHAIKDIAPIKQAWEKLESGQDMTFFQTYFWNELLVKQWQVSKLEKRLSRIFIYTVKKNDDVVLIAPIIFRKINLCIAGCGVKKGIYLLGSEGETDYLNLIYDNFDNEAFTQLISQIKADFLNCCIFFELIREGTLLDLYLKKNGMKSTGSYVSVSVPIYASSDAYSSSLSKHTRQNIRTAVNRADTDEVEYSLKIVQGVVDKGICNALNDIHEKRLKTIENNNLSKNMIKRLFFGILNKWRQIRRRSYNIIIASMETNANSLLILTEIDESISGYLYGVLDGNTLRILQNCYDEQFYRYSPMFRGAYEFICDECSCHKYGLREVDFTRGDESYKYTLGGTETNLNSYAL